MKRISARFFLLLLLCLNLVIPLTSCKKTFLYREHLDDTLLTIEDRANYTLRDVAFYIWYEESLGDTYAKIYNKENPRSYWNAHTNGEFMSVLIKDSTLNLIIHDALLYQKAQAEGVSLTEDEMQEAQKNAQDSYKDLNTEQLEALGISLEDFQNTLEKIATARKYMLFRCETDKREITDWETNGIAYQALLSESSYKVNTMLWEQIDIGKITLFY